MAASDIPDPRSVTDSREGTSAGPRASEDAQLYPQDGVSINVSSVAMDGGVLDRGLLNLLERPPPRATPVHPVPSPMPT